MSALIYVCRGCGAETEVTGGGTSDIAWKSHVRQEFPAGTYRIIAVIHMRPPNPHHGPCGLADPKLGTPDELTIDALTLDEVMGHAAAALRRVMPLDKAERLIATLHHHMLWGQSVDHETQERADALKEALRKALIPLGPIENVPGLRGLHGRAASRRTVEQVNRARQRIMDAIERDNEWLDAPRRNAETARKRRKRRGEGESE